MKLVFQHSTGMHNISIYEDPRLIEPFTVEVWPKGNRIASKWTLHPSLASAKEKAFEVVETDRNAEIMAAAYESDA